MKLNNPIYKYFYPFIASIFLALIFLYPFSLNLTTFYQDVGDYPINGWIMWYNFNAIITGKIFNQYQYFNSNQFSLFPTTLAYTDHLFIPSLLLFTPIYQLAKNLVLSVNLTIFSIFVLSQFISYSIFKRLTNHTLGSFIGSLIFTYNPLTFAHLFEGHIAQMFKLFIPLVFYYLLQLFKSPNIKNIFLFSTFFTLNALTAHYFQVFANCLIFLITSTVLFAKLIKKEFSPLIKIIKLSPIFFIFLIPILYFDLPYLQFSNNEQVSRTIGENSYFSARIVDWLSTHPSSLLYGEITKSLDPIRKPEQDYYQIPYAERTLFLNLIPIFLFILGIYYLYQKNQSKFSKNYKQTLLKLITSISNLNINLYFSLLLFLTFILSFGPIFLGFSGNNGSIHLPYYFLYEYTPLLQGVRVPTRIQFFFYLPFAFFAVIGTTYLLNKYKKYSYLIFTLLILLLIYENTYIKSFNQTSAILTKYSNLSPEVINLLANKKTIHYPLHLPDIGQEAVYLNWSTLTNENIFNGASSYTPPDQTEIIKKYSKLDDKSLKIFHILGLDYLIIHEDLYRQEKNQILNLDAKTLNNLLVYNHDDIKILDLKKLSITFSNCNFDKDIQITYQSIPPQSSPTGKQIHLVILKNNSDCYLVNDGQKRYLNKDIYLNFQRINLNLKLPLLITPNQQIEFSEVYNNLKLN